VNSTVNDRGQNTLYALEARLMWLFGHISVKWLQYL
jgi:hypothetical protein